MANTALQRTGQLLLTNNSSGSVAQGDVVVVDTALASAFTTTTTLGYVSGTPGVVLEPNGIAQSSIGMIAVQGYVPIVNLSTSGSLGNLIRTNSVSKQAVPHASPAIAGDFGEILGTGATPAAILWGSVNMSAGAGSDSNAIHVNVNSEISGITEKTTPVAADLVVIEDSAASDAKKKVQISNIPQVAFPAWTQYTPTWTGSVTNPVINNGTLVGYYLVVGKTMFLTIRMVIGSSTTFGSGTYRWAMPSTYTATVIQVMAGWTLDNGTINKSCTARIGLASNALIEVIGYNGNEFSPTVPQTWATGDTLNLSGVLMID